MLESFLVFVGRYLVFIRVAACFEVLALGCFALGEVQFVENSLQQVHFSLCWSVASLSYFLHPLQHLLLGGIVFPDLLLRLHGCLVVFYCSFLCCFELFLCCSLNSFFCLLKFFCALLEGFLLRVHNKNRCDQFKYYKLQTYIKYSKKPNFVIFFWLRGYFWLVGCVTMRA